MAKKKKKVVKKKKRAVSKRKKPVRVKKKRTAPQRKPKTKTKKKSKKATSKKAAKKRPAKKAAIPLPPPADEPPTPSFSLQEGESAPDFNAPTDQGNVVSLADFRGQKLVLYFYPKDDTPGCTREACAFRDGISQIQAKGAAVLGVSADSVASHQAFRDKYTLNFPLLSDEDRKLVQDYGVWKERNMYGRTYMGIERTTFLIDEEGRIRRIFPKVNVETHYDEILQALG